MQTRPAQRPPRLAGRKKVAREDPRKVLEAQPWERVRALLEEAGVAAAHVVPRLFGYAEAVISWNRNVSNLISTNDELRFVERHLIESLGGLPMARSFGASRWMDLGSGAGLPAIPLILSGVGQSWMLVEARRMKCLFLDKFLRDAGLSDVRVNCIRLEDLVARGSMARSADAMTARASLKAMPTIELARKVLTPGGHVVMWKGSSWESELHYGPVGGGGWRLVETRQLPGSNCVILSVVLDESS